MLELQPVSSPNAPAAVGAYSQAMVVGDLIFTAGTLPLDPVSKAMPADIKAQTARALDNLKAILEAAGSGLDRVVKASIFLADIKDFQAVNEVYAGYFTPPYPARACYQVAALPLGARIEIEMVAAK